MIIQRIKECETLSDSESYVRSETDFAAIEGATSEIPFSSASGFAFLPENPDESCNRILLIIQEKQGGIDTKR